MTDWCAVQFTNKYLLDTSINTHTYLLYVSDSGNINQFYYLNVNVKTNTVGITECSEAEVSYLETQCSICILITFDNKDTAALDPKLLYENYQKDVFYINLGFDSYTAHLQNLIDKLIDQQGHVKPKMSTAAPAIRKKCLSSR